MALSSAGLLIASFPSFNQPWCAWVALVPWLLLLRHTSTRAAFWWSWCVGLLFFLGSMWWMLHLIPFGGVGAVVGWVVLSAYLGLYFAFFGQLTSRLVTRHWSLITVPASWVAFEYLRSHLFSGLGWNLLAYSQTPWITLIQVADLTGAWGVSFLVVMVNAALASAVRSQRRPLAIAGIVVALAVGYGLWRIPRAASAETVRVAVVQGNVPQEEKWNEASRDSILERYDALTREAAREHPQLIVWPETAVPGLLGLHESVTQRVTGLARAAGIPMLVGSPLEALKGTTWQLTNSAVLVEPTGRFDQRYDKVHLVPFGEFIPFEGALPWLRTVLPPIGEFVPGHNYTVFETPVSGFGFRVSGSNAKREMRNSKLPFSTLICFEDLFPEIARRFVSQGARLLLVITNDAWFGPTGAAYQHAQASTFRAVELRTPVACAANTGWSGCIDPAGRWIGSVHDAAGTELFVAGTHTCELPVTAAPTLYLRWGDWFAFLCLLATAGWMALRFRRIIKGSTTGAHRGTRRAG